jgi:hypothetical protein
MEAVILALMIWKGEIPTSIIKLEAMSGKQADIYATKVMMVG